MTRHRYRHRLALKNPRAALVSEILVVQVDGEWHMHPYARGVRAGTLRVPADIGAELLEQLIPAGWRLEVEDE